MFIPVNGIYVELGLVPPSAQKGPVLPKRRAASARWLLSLFAHWEMKSPSSLCLVASPLAQATSSFRGKLPSAESGLN